MGEQPRKNWMKRRAPGIALLLALAGCTERRDDSAVRVDVIGQQGQAEKADPNAPAARVMLSAVAQGLLAYDAHGEIVDALAESWIVEDAGQSYIFRLKRLNWSDGEPVKAEQVASLLRARMKANPLAMAGLRPQVRAMTDRVIEIRLDAPLPTFLQLLAQPEFGIQTKSGGTGPYAAQKGESMTALVPVPPPAADAGESEESEPADIERRLLRTSRAALALVLFKDRKTDMVLGGRAQHLPLIAAVGLDDTSLRVDPVNGLLGLAIIGKSDFLDEVAVRDVLSRVVDRAALSTAWGLQGWRTADYPLPTPLGLDRQPSAPSWTGRPMAERIASAREVIMRWRAEHGEPPMLRIALPEGPGASLLFIRLAQDFGQIGIRVDRVAMDARADLRLIDEVAPFDSALWYLSRLDCAAGLRCDPQASALLAEAREAEDPAVQATRLGEAERAIVANAGYIPLGQPIRWSLATRRLTGFQLSPRGMHPLNRLIAAPN